LNEVPSTSALIPTGETAGAIRSPLNLQVMGSNFVPGSMVRWNGENRTTVLVGPDRVDAMIPASDLLEAGTAEVTVFTPAPGGGTSNPQPFVISNPMPTVTAISPSGATAGGAGFTLVVTGSNLLPGSTVRWNGSNRATTYIGNSQLRAQIPASDLAMAGNVSVTVFTSGPGGGPSNAQTFTINAIVASPESQDEDAAPPAGTTEPEPAQPATAPHRADGSLPAVDAADSEPEGARSEASTGEVRRPVALAAAMGPAVPSEVPVLEALEPETANAGDGEFILKVHGKNLVPGAVVRWNGKDLRTSFGGRDELLAEIPSSHVAAPGTFRITVINPGPESPESRPLEFTVR
jgi:hypothetical protein